jgi:molecular chaperone DnaJ
MADYYDLLGVARDADPDTLKRAYRRLARQYHPDVNKDPGAEDRFKEIGRAYEVLSDPQTRGRYDQFGEAGLGGGGGMPDMGDMGGFADLFETFFSGFGGAAPGQGPRRRGPNQGDDLRLDLTISFRCQAGQWPHHLRNLRRLWPGAPGYPHALRQLHPGGGLSHL